MLSNFEKISVIGLGYIGLPTAAVFASRKFNVIGVDVDQRAVDIINRGQVHIVEPDLDMIVHAAVTQGFLRATTIPEPADAFLIAVPTPFSEGHKPDLNYIESASKSVAKVLKSGDLVVLESTSPVGATEKMADWMAEIRPDLTFPSTHGENSDIRIAHCPERVLPGQVLRELVQNDRVIGGMTPRCSDAATRLYKIFVQGECIVTNARTAEMCKLTENSFRDVNIAFANELSVICEKLDIDVWELIKLANRHPRVKILQPGPGVGGHCIAVDPWFIVSAAPNDANLIRAARMVNDGKPAWVIEKVEHAIHNYLLAHPGKNEKKLRIACFGLAFKPDIDDLRESPSLSIVAELSRRYPGQIVAIEPHIKEISNCEIAEHVELWGAEDAIRGSEILLLLVDHSTFKNLRIPIDKEKFTIDTRGVWKNNFFKN